MSTISITTIAAKESFSDLINRVSHHHERFILTRRGKEIAALVPIELLKMIEEFINKQDLEDAMAALKEAREQGTIDLEYLSEKLGCLT